MGTSHNSQDFFGDPYVEHRDDRGNIVGTSERTTDFFGDPIILHKDRKGNIVGRSEETTDFFGDPIALHKDREGNIVGRSEECENWLGERYIRHTGETGFGTERSIASKSAGGGFAAADGGAAAGGAFGMMPVLTIAAVVLDALYTVFQDFFIRHELVFRLGAEIGYPVLLFICLILSLRRHDETAAVRMGFVTAVLTGALMALTMEVLRPLDWAYTARWEANPEDCMEWLVFSSSFLMYYAMFLAFPLSAALYRRFLRAVPRERREDMREAAKLHLIFGGAATAIVFYGIYTALDFEGYTFFNALFSMIILLVHAGLSAAIMIGISVWILNRGAKA